jgi:hypothetical protein
MDSGGPLEALAITRQIPRHSRADRNALTLSPEARRQPSSAGAERSAAAITSGKAAWLQAKYIQRIQAVESLSNLYRGKGGYWEDSTDYQWYAGIRSAVLVALVI